MTYKITITFSLLLTACTLFGQKIALGVRAGYTLSNVSYRLNRDFNAGEVRPGDNAEVLHSLHAGAEVRVPFDDRFSLLAGLQYVRKGYEAQLQVNMADPVAIHQFLHYLEVPVMFDFVLWEGLSAQAGVVPGVLVAARHKSQGESFDPQEFKLYETFDLGLAAGLEWRFAQGFFLAGRFSQGFLPVLKLAVTDENGNDDGELNAYNRTLQFSAGYRFNL